MILNEYIKDNEAYVEYSIAKTRIQEDLKEDAKQFVIMHLVQLFKKRFKYTDFYWVIRSVIRRKIIDFQSSQDKMTKGYIFENQTDSTSDGIDLGDLCTTVKKESYDEEQRKIDIVEYISVLHGKIRNIKELGQIFTEWDREFFEVILELYDYGNFTEMKDVAECMGYTNENKQDFALKLNILRNKIKRCIKDKTLETFND